MWARMNEAKNTVRFALAEAVLRKLWARDLLTDDELAAVLEKARNKIFVNSF